MDFHTAYETPDNIQIIYTGLIVGKIHAIYFHNKKDCPRCNNQYAIKLCWVTVCANCGKELTKNNF